MDFGWGFTMRLEVCYRHRAARPAHERSCTALWRVLSLKMVTQCAMLEESGLFVVLADRVSDFQVTTRQPTE